MRGLYFVTTSVTVVEAAIWMNTCM